MVGNLPHIPSLCLLTRLTETLIMANWKNTGYSSLVLKRRLAFGFTYKTQNLVSQLSNTNGLLNKTINAVWRIHIRSLIIYFFRISQKKNFHIGIVLWLFLLIEYQIVQASSCQTAPNDSPVDWIWIFVVLLWDLKMHLLKIHSWQDWAWELERCQGHRLQQAI